jgi:hypothetical protein
VAWPGARRAALAGLLVALVYLGGAAASGALSPLARRPLLDGLAPPTPYRWVRPPAALAPTNKRPTPMRFTVAFGPGGRSDVGAFSTQDGQFNLVFGEGAFPPEPKQTGVEFEVVPIDPATVAPVPTGLLPAGNAYRFTAAYQPSKRPVDRLAGEVNAGVVYPLLTTPVASPSSHLLLYSPDGKAAWTRLESTDAPGVHQVSARVPGPGHFIVAIPPGSPVPAARSLADRLRDALPFLALAVLVVAAAVVLLRRQAEARGRPAAGPPPATSARARRERLRTERAARPPRSRGAGDSSSGGTKPATTAKPAEVEKPATGRKPAENEKPATGKKPAAEEKPAAGRKPAENEKPATGRRPAADNKPPGGRKPGGAKRRRRR